MPSYAAFLGHQPTVSLAELRATIPEFHLQRIVESRVALFTTRTEIAPPLLATLGGTILLAESLSTLHPSWETIPQILQETVAHVKGKVTFGLRCIGVPPPRIRTLYREYKDTLRRAGRPCRYIGSERLPAHTALLHETGILDGKHGIELVIIADDDSLWVGKTIAAHNPTAYAKRDIGKPARDMRAGILPPKLAQIMLNLGEWLLSTREKRPTPIVWDPFCGSGVIPMECLLRGWMPLASDSSQKAVDACKRNIEWLRRTFAIPAAKIPSVVQKHNALKPIDFSSVRDQRLRAGPTLIVTETSLGPSLRSRPTKQQAQRLRTENERLQIAFLRTVASTLPSVPIVCTWPVWHPRTGPLFLEKIWKEIEKLGLEAVLPPETTQTSPLRPTLLYRRPDQYVAREIILLRRK